MSRSRPRAPPAAHANSTGPNTTSATTANPNKEESLAPMRKPIHTQQRSSLATVAARPHREPGQHHLTRQRSRAPRAASASSRPPTEAEALTWWPDWRGGARSPFSGRSGGDQAGGPASPTDCRQLTDRQDRSSTNSPLSSTASTPARNASGSKGTSSSAHPAAAMAARSGAAGPSSPAQRLPTSS